MRPAAKGSKRPPFSPEQGWLSKSRHVLHAPPTHCDRWSQRSEMTSGELLPGQPVPLLKSRKQLTREEAITLWRQKRREGWKPCGPQW